MMIPVLPLTKKPLHGNWGQEEYVKAMSLDIRFTDHGLWWHYMFFEPAVCLSVYMDPYLGPQPPIVHTFKPTIEWITQASAAVAKVERAKR